MSIFDYFRHIIPTTDQLTAAQQIEHFLTSEKDVFILKGYAGTGKTTLLKVLVDYLEGIERPYQLMAPTGRAAKIVRQKTRYEATTVHKGIYSFDDLVEIQDAEGDASSFLYQYKINYNPGTYGSVLIVDEASMVSDIMGQGEFFRFGSGHLLTDLITYSRIQSNEATKIIFIGDPAQLPPVGMAFSPALDANYIQDKFGPMTAECELKEVKRQDVASVVLDKASSIRRCLTSGFFNDFDLAADGKNLFNPPYKDFLETYKESKSRRIVVTYKNKTALGINQRIREDKYGATLPIQPSDQVIIGANNYSLGIMNGEFAVVSEVADYTEERDVKFYQKGGETTSVKLVWRQVVLILPDDEGQPRAISCKILENYLYGDNYLTPEEQRALYIDFKNRYPNLKPRTEEFKQAILSDAYFNCVLLKYGYAVTCHKAQGGEWDNVFVFWDRGVSRDFNFLDEPHDRSGKTNSDFFRWAYTAITRTSDKLFCINPPRFSSFSEMTFVDIPVQSAYNDLTGEVAQTIDIDLTEELMAVLHQFGLDEAPLPLQDHFLRLWTHVQKQYIDIIAWEQVNYEIRYAFRREGQTAALKFWINGKNEFRPNFQKIPSGTNSDEFFEVISDQVKQAPTIQVNRTSVDGILSKALFDFETEESKPFLRALYDSLQPLLDTRNIVIADIEHMAFKERYTLERSGRQCVVYFEYNAKGFFGRVLPVAKQCDDYRIPNDLKAIINQLKVKSHVV